MNNVFKRKKSNTMNFEELDSNYIDLSLLEIIGTKKCNFACEHCMRGDAQNEDISKETLDAIFEKVAIIENLSIGGGEISLTPHILVDLLDSLKNHNVIVNGFAFTTNGTTVSEEFINNLLKIKEYVDECRKRKLTCFKSEAKSHFYIVVSTDDFHLDQMIKKGYTLENLLENIKTYRSVFGDDSVHFKGYCDYEVINEGRATNLPKTYKIDKVVEHPLTKRFSYTKLSENIALVNGTLSISTDGEVLPGCNYSFENEKVFSVGNIKEKKLSELFSHMNIIPVEFKHINKFSDKLTKAMSISKKAERRYNSPKSLKKLNYLWYLSTPEQKQ